MTEWFIVANSFAAPFCSDQSTGFVAATNPRAALLQFAAAYRHPAGLYAADCFASADGYHKGAKPLARWLSNHAAAVAKATCVRSDEPGHLEIDGKRVIVSNPKDGTVLE